MSHPPHLPLPEKKSPAQAERVYIVLVSVFLSLAAGMVGALSVFAWIVPGGYAEGGILVSRGQNGFGTALYTEPEASVVRKVKNVTTEVFLKNQILPNGYYGEGALVGSGIMLTSNGWGVVYAPQLTSAGVIPGLMVRDIQGIWYTPDTVIADKKNSLVYFKLTGNEFYVTSFPDWRTLTTGREIWTYNGREWRGRIIGEIESISNEKLFAAADERRRFVLSPLSSVNSGVVLSAAGDFLGFSDAGGMLHDAWIIQYSIPGLLDSGAIEKVEVEWKGSMVETVEEGKLVKGFLVDQVGKITTNGLKRGDIVRAINGTAVTEMNLYRLVREMPLNATIWREGQVFDILVQ
ncbi:MAG TPA: hypothetical protein PK295_01700 [Candidatus Magasanikbacteria bacterium]|nr:hypothetical protein [Candidatus Magasanikbacteria bacterium]